MDVLSIKIMKSSTSIKIYSYQAEAERIDKDDDERKSLVSTGDRSAKTRTYNYPQGRITDHRINKTIYNLSNFMNGDIQEMIDALIMAENAQKQ